MAITVANLLAQIGADVTQFRLGMNEVDTRIRLAEAKAKASGSQIANLQNMALRAADASARYADMAQRVPVSLLTSQFKAAYAAAGKAQAEMTRASTAYTNAINTGTDKVQKTTLKALDTAQKEFKKLADEAENAGKKMDSALSRRATYERRSNELSYSSGYLAQRAGDSSSVADAAYAFNMARAEREAQNANEYRVRSINAMSAAAIKAGVVIELALGAATKVGADFNLMLTQTVHNTSLNSAEADKMRTAIKQMALESGADLTALAHSFQTIENYGYSVSDSQKILRQSMMASVATGSDLKATSELLAGTMKNFNIPVDQASRGINFLYGVSKLAKGELQDLVKTMGPAFATANVRGVSLNETGAAFVLFTRHQIDAAKSVTQFVNVMQRVSDPSVKVQHALANVDKQVTDLGISLTRDFSRTGLREKGITGVFEDIIKSAERIKVKPEDLAAAFIPAQRGTIGATVVTKFISEYIDIAKKLQEETRKNDAVQKAYDETLKEAGVQLDRLKNAAILASADISKAMVPVLTDIVSKVQSASKWWSGLGDSMQANIVSTTMWVGAGLIVLGTIGKLTVGIANLRTAMVEMKLVSESITFLGMIGGLTKFLGVAGLVVGTLVAIKQVYDDMEKHKDLPDQMAKKRKAELDAMRAAEAKGEYVVDPAFRRQGMPNEFAMVIDNSYIRAQKTKDDAAKTAADTKLKYERDVTNILKNINNELNTQVIDAKRRSDLIKSRDAHLAEAEKRGLSVPMSVSGIFKVDPFNNPYKNGMPDPDKLSGIYAGAPKAKKVSNKLTDDQKEARDANNYIEGLRQALQKVNVEGRTGELMWMAHDNALMKVGGHYYMVAQSIIQSIEAQERQKTVDKEGIDLLMKWQKENNKNEGVTEYDIARAKVKTAIGQGWNIVLAGITNSLINQAEATDRVNKEQKQYAEVMELVNKPLLKQVSVFEEVFKKMAASKELMAKYGLVWAVGMASVAQANHDAAEKTKKYAEAQHMANEELMRLNNIASNRRAQTHTEQLNIDLDNGRFGLIQPGDVMKLQQAAWLADQADSLRKSSDNWAKWGDSAVSTVDTTTKKMVVLKKAFDERFLPMWKELADGIDGIFNDMFHNLRDHGFKSLFSSVVGGFERMLFDMAAKWASSQLVRLIVGAVGGSRAQDALGLGDIFSSAAGVGAASIWSSFGGASAGAAAGSAFGGAFGAGGLLTPGRSYIVGDTGPERIQLGNVSGMVSRGGGVVHNHYWNITTPNALSFVESRSAVQQRTAQAVSRGNMRNG